MFGILINFLIGFNAIKCTAINLDKDQIIKMFEESEIQVISKSLKAQIAFCVLNQNVIGAANYPTDDFKQRIEELLANYSALMGEYENMNTILESKINGTRTNIEHMSAHMKTLLEKNKDTAQFEEQLNALNFNLPRLLNKQQIIFGLIGIFRSEMQELEWLIKKSQIVFSDTDLNRYVKVIKENTKIIAELEICLNR